MRIILKKGDDNQHFRKLFYGEIRTEENFELLENSEYKKLNEEINDYMEAFKEKLSHADYRRLNKILELANGLNSMEDAYYFVYGFKLATTIWQEALNPSSITC